MIQKHLFFLWLQPLLSHKLSLLLNSLNLIFYRAMSIITCLTYVNNLSHRCSENLEQSYWNNDKQHLLRLCYPIKTKTAENECSLKLMNTTVALHSDIPHRNSKHIALYFFSTEYWHRKWSTWAVHICWDLFHCIPFSSKSDSDGEGTSKEQKSQLNRKLSWQLLGAGWRR